jgi:7,8-dihydro-6-hydroxymethylpterin-pyrophosphokinase
MQKKLIYKFLNFVMKWSSKIHAWAWVKHLKYTEKGRFERHYEKNY